MFLKLKLKREQRKNSSVVAKRHNERQQSCDAATDVSALLTCLPEESRKRKTSADVHHDDSVPRKKLKFSSLFTNNPEIPCMGR